MTERDIDQLEYYSEYGGFHYNKGERLFVYDWKFCGNIGFYIIDLKDCSCSVFIYCDSSINSKVFSGESNTYLIQKFETPKYYFDLSEFDNIEDLLAGCVDICDNLLDEYINQDSFYNTISQARLKLRVGDIVRHFKADLSDKDYVYEIIAISINCSDDSRCVTYRELFGKHNTYVREYDEFMGFVDHEKYPDAKQIHRFEIIGHNSKGGLYGNY